MVTRPTGDGSREKKDSGEAAEGGLVDFLWLWPSDRWFLASVLRNDVSDYPNQVRTHRRWAWVRLPLGPDLRHQLLPFLHYTLTKFTYSTLVLWLVLQRRFTPRLQIKPHLYLMHDFNH
jgi:hypothetical protein